jgi:hypothetical protein
MWKLPITFALEERGPIMADRSDDALVVESATIILPSFCPPFDPSRPVRHEQSNDERIQAGVARALRLAKAGLDAYRVDQTPGGRQ